MRAVLLVAAVVAVALPIAPAQAAPTGCAPATVSVGDYRQYEGTGPGTTAFTFAVTVAAAPGCTATGSVDYVTEHVTTSPADLVAASGTLTWTNSTAATTVTVGVVRDSLGEPEEAFTLRLLNPTNLTIARDKGRGQIIDDDQPPVDTSLDGGKICWRSTGTADVGVHLSTPARAPITVHYRTIPLGDNRPGYYPVKDGLITFPTGATTATAPVRLITDQSLPDEQFLVEIFSPSAGTLGLTKAPVTVKSQK
ncbi:Calx-beta domain-containing protein [Actinokineospora inagensis]|uniref:Calx-beta domain-containing protein n=1 Tax=Actinokineospora inagensis TaxID=103730 RepID=UPI00047E57C5|nr:Calx-beta domain-containing protein [Actinokineospora inagensis]